MGILSIRARESLLVAHTLSQNGVMVAVARRIRAKRVACCFKMRDENGCQTRWSVCVDSNGLVSSTR